MSEDVLLWKRRTHRLRSPTDSIKITLWPVSKDTHCSYQNVISNIEKNFKATGPWIAPGRPKFFNSFKDRAELVLLFPTFMILRFTNNRTKISVSLLKKTLFPDGNSPINPLTPELNPYAQRCLTRFLLGILLLEPCISLIYAWKTNKCNNYPFSLLIMYGSSYMFRHYIAILRERS
jgi:hypothetical protein